MKRFQVSLCLEKSLSLLLDSDTAIGLITTSAASSSNDVNVPRISDLANLVHVVDNDTYSVWINKNSTWLRVVNVVVTKSLKTGNKVATELRCELKSSTGENAGEKKIIRTLVTAETYGIEQGKFWAVYQYDSVLRMQSTDVSESINQLL